MQLQYSSNNAYNGIAPEDSQAHKTPKKEEAAVRSSRPWLEWYILPTSGRFYFQHRFRIANLILFNGRTYWLSILFFLNRSARTLTPGERKPRVKNTSQTGAGQEPTFQSSIESQAISYLGFAYRSFSIVFVSIFFFLTEWSKLKLHDADLAASLTKIIMEEQGLKGSLLNHPTFLMQCSWWFVTLQQRKPAEVLQLGQLPYSWMLTLGKRFSISELSIPQSLLKLGLIVVFPKAAGTIRYLNSELWLNSHLYFQHFVPSQLAVRWDHKCSAMYVRTMVRKNETYLWICPFLCR